MTKISQNAAGGITLEDLLFCSEGPAEEERTSPAAVRANDLFQEKFQALSMGQRKMVLDFMDFLANR